MLKLRMNDRMIADYFLSFYMHRFIRLLKEGNETGKLLGQRRCRRGRNIFYPKKGRLSHSEQKVRLRQIQAKKTMRREAFIQNASRRAIYTG